MTQTAANFQIALKKQVAKGTRATGSKAGTYALVGPNWKGTLPKGVKAIDEIGRAHV